MPTYVATVAVPGYLPMGDDAPTFTTARDAWQYLVNEIDRSWDEYPDDANGACVEAHTAMHNVDQTRPGSVWAPTPGYDGDHDLGLVYSVDVVADDMPDADTVERVGLDSTGRTGGPYSWDDVAARVADAAAESFWRAVADYFPGASGDLAPDDAARFSDAARAVVVAWIDANAR